MKQPDRPATLRRAPRPAPDENVDPVDTPPRIQPAPAAPVTPPPARSRRREVTMPFSTRLAPDVVDLIDQAAAAHDLTIRAVIEAAVRTHWGSQNRHHG